MGGIGSTFLLAAAIAIRLVGGPLVWQALLVCPAGLGLVVVLLNVVRIGFLVLGWAGRIEAQVQTLEEIAARYL
jgi:hypothetical protein